MQSELTSTEAAKVVGVSPSTFRAYVARGQAPKPRRRAGGVNFWSFSDLATWRPGIVSKEQARTIKSDTARRISRGRSWEEGTRRLLVQLGLSHLESQMLIDGRVPGGIDVQTYKDARDIIRIRRRLKRRLGVPPEAEHGNMIDAKRAIEIAANEVTAGSNVFEELCSLTESLTTIGEPEILAPNRFDPNFWDSQETAVSFRDYLLSLDRTEVPEVLPR